MCGGGIFKNHFIVTIYILALAICVSTLFVPTNIKAAVSLNLDYENGAYLVRDFSGLENLSEYVYTGGSTSGKTFKLTNSIDMESQSFIPIGTIYNGKTYYFDGTFDGQGYTLLNINIDTKSTYATGDLGIFGYLNGTVKNLSICYGDIYLTTTDKSAGGIVGSMYGSAKVERCYNLGTKIYTYSGSRSFNIGGVVGYQDSSNCEVTQCFNLATIDNNGTSTVKAGGIVGNAQGTITECFNQGTITSGTTSASVSYAGGITGQGGTISNCYNKGSVTAQAETNDITDSNNYNIISTDDDPLFNGVGYVPYNNDARYYDVYVEDEIKANYKNLNISNYDIGTGAGKKSEAYAGGISGKTDKTINHSYNIATVKGGFSNIKYTIHYLVGATTMASTSWYWADYYVTFLEENISFANPIANGTNFNSCYSNVSKLNGNSENLYECKYKVFYMAVRIVLGDGYYYPGPELDYLRAIRDEKYEIFNCDAYGIHTPRRNPHPIGNYALNEIVNKSSADYTQKVDSYFLCAPISSNREQVSKYTMSNIRVSVANSESVQDRTIRINLLYDRYDLIEVPAAPDKDDDLGFADVIPFGGEETKMEPKYRNQESDGNKMLVTLKNNFAAKPFYCTESSLNSTPYNFNQSIWGRDNYINNGNPYLRCFYWKDSAQSF